MDFNNKKDNMEESKSPELNFDNLKLDADLLKGVYLYGFTKPSPIQIKGISSISTGRDCILQSQSGTGKTATYLLGVMNRLNTNENTCQGIVISPTRELTNQIYDVAENLGKYTSYKIVKCIGGTDVKDNKDNLKNAQLIIGTLGRIFHMILEKKINLYGLKFVVIDEADKLLAEGIDKKLQDFFHKIPIGCQIILISATVSGNLFTESKKFIHDPIKVLLKSNEVVVNLISQFYLDVENEEYKFDTLLDLYNLVSTSQAIIFCNTIKKVEWLEKSLKENNFPITTIHSEMTQEQRNSVINEFREGKTRLLLTTDLLSRGIDIPQVNLVINFDLPINKETYIHRIGRCGRFDKKGVSITLVNMNDPYDNKTFNRMKSYYKMDIKQLPDNIETYL
jgi:superfamily II DNA/RNA helicase